MNKIKLTLEGIIIGCTIVSFIAVAFALVRGPENFVLSGTTIVNSVFGASIIGVAFALSSIIYERENIPLYYQVMFQMGIGFAVLIIVAIALQWMPLNQGILPIIVWILIALIIGFAIWFGFYLYEKNEAKKINKQLNKLNNS